MTPQTNQEPPIADPVVTIGGRTLTVQYNLLAQFKLSEWGIDPREFSCLMDEKSASPKRVYYAIQCFAACVSGNYVNETAPTAEEWATRIDQYGPELEIMSKAVGVALGKHIRTMVARRPPSGTTATVEASSNVVQ